MLPHLSGQYLQADVRSVSSHTTMTSFLRLVKFALEYFIRGRKRLPQIAVPPDFDYPAPDDRLMWFLEEMFRAHGAHAFRSGAWVVVDGGRLFVRACHFDHRHHPDSVVLQADFVCVASGGQHIIESFAGIGPDVASALTDACQSFQDSSFHVLFVTLLGRICDHVDRETWCIGGMVRVMTFGWLRTRGELPPDFWPTIFEAMQRQIEAVGVQSGLHWVRYFYANVPGHHPTIEVLVDNQSCQELSSQAAILRWPSSDAFYSVRLFFTIQDGASSLPAGAQDPRGGVRAPLS